MTTDDPATTRTVVRNFYEALNTGELSLLDSALAPEWEAVPALRTGPGPDGWKASIAHLRTVFSELTVSIEDLLVDGDRVAVRTLNRGTHTGELLGVAGTGRQIEIRASDVHRIEAGRIVQTWHLEDYFGIAGQLGLTFGPAE